MDWALAIDINRTALIRIVAELIAMAGGAAEGMPRALYSAVLRILRPAESAVRRLIVIAAHGITYQFSPRTRGSGEHKRAGGRMPATAQFQLFDARKRFSFNRRSYFKPGQGPRLTFFPVDDDPRVPLFRPPVPDAITIELCPPRAATETVPAARLHRRLAAINAALADIPKQALRLARWQARRARMKAAKFENPLRPGRPPGHRQRPRHEVDGILRDCHGLARSLPSINSS